jgi:hypothetical protein
MKFLTINGNFECHSSFLFISLSLGKGHNLYNEETVGGH